MTLSWSARAVACPARHRMTALDPLAPFAGWLRQEHRSSVPAAQTEARAVRAILARVPVDEVLTGDPRLLVDRLRLPASPYRRAILHLREWFAAGRPDVPFAVARVVSTPPRRTPLIAGADADEVIRRFDARESVASIARSYGCSESPVRRVLIRAGRVPWTHRRPWAAGGRAEA